MSSLSSESYGLLLLLLSAILYSGMGCFLKLASDTGLPSTQLVFFRAIFQGFFVCVAMCFCREDCRVSATYAATNVIATNVSGHANNANNSVSANNDDVSLEMLESETTQLIPTKSSKTNKSTKQSKLLLIQIPFGRTTQQQKLTTLRGILGGLGFILYYYSIKTLPLGDAISLLSLSPIHTLLLARIVLDEPICVTHVIATIASVLGAFLIAGPSFFYHFDHNDRTGTGTGTGIDDGDGDGTGIGDGGDHTTKIIGYITAFLGSFFGACVITLIRKAGTLGISSLQLLFSWATFGILFSILFSFVLEPMEGSWYIPPLFTATTTSTDITTDITMTEIMTTIATTGTIQNNSINICWWYILGMCTVGSIAHFLLNYAGRMGSAGLASIIRSSGIVFAYIWQITIFGVIPTFTTLLGVMLVLFSLLVIAVQKWNDEMMVLQEKQQQQQQRELEQQQKVEQQQHKQQHQVQQQIQFTNTISNSNNNNNNNNNSSSSNDSSLVKKKDIDNIEATTDELSSLESL